MLQIIYLLFVMSLSGTAAFLLYLATTSLLDSYISAGMRYLCLKICMLFFLIPFPILKHLFVFLPINMIITEGAEDRFPSGPADDPCKDDTKEDSNGVNHHITL